jgi:hypothetical protein
MEGRESKNILSSSIFKFTSNEDVFSLVSLNLSIASKNRISYFDHSSSYFIDPGKKENLIETEKVLSQNI